MSVKFPQSKLKSLAESLSGKELAILVAEYYANSKITGKPCSDEIDLIISTVSYYSQHNRRLEYYFYHFLWGNVGFLGLDLQTTNMQLEIYYFKFLSLMYIFGDGVIAGSIADESQKDFVKHFMTLGTWTNEVIQQMVNHIEVIQSIERDYFDQKVNTAGNLVEKSKEAINNLEKHNNTIFPLVNEFISLNPDFGAPITLVLSPEPDQDWVEETRNQMLNHAGNESGFNWKSLHGTYNGH